MKRLRKVLIWGVPTLVLLVVGGWLFENWRGARAWEEAKARAEKEGVSLVRADYAGPVIPDDENLLMDPVFSAEFYREGDDRLRGWEELPVVDDDSDSDGLRPWAGRAFSYQEYFEMALGEDEARLKLAEAAEGFEERLDKVSEVILRMPPHLIFAESDAVAELDEVADWLTAMRDLTRCIKDSALMALRSNEGALAFERVRVLGRLSQITAGPSLLAFSVSSGIFSSNLDLVWEGIRLRVWSEKQLIELSAMLTAREFLEPITRVFEYEAASGVEMLESFNSHSRLGFNVANLSEWVGSSGPEGWHQQRKAWTVLTNLELIDIARNRNFKLKEEMQDRWPVSELSPNNQLSSLLSFGPNMINRVCWVPETKRLLALIALSAERGFLANGKYPKSLKDVSLDFPVIDLTDPERRDLAYALGPKGRPQIWSRHDEEANDDRLRWQFWSE